MENNSGNFWHVLCLAGVCTRKARFGNDV